MAVLEDLTWSQLRDALTDQLGIDWITNTVPYNGLYKLSFVLNITSNTPTGMQSKSGVVYFISKLLEAAQIAQVQANTGQVAGERLNAFSAPTVGAPAGNFVPVTRSLTSRVVSSSAHIISGPTV